MKLDSIQSFNIKQAGSWKKKRIDSFYELLFSTPTFDVNCEDKTFQYSADDLQPESRAQKV